MSKSESILHAVAFATMAILGGTMLCLGAYILNQLPPMPVSDFPACVTGAHIQATGIMIAGMCGLIVGVLAS